MSILFKLIFIDKFIEEKWTHITCTVHNYVNKQQNVEVQKSIN